MAQPEVVKRDPDQARAQGLEIETIGMNIGRHGRSTESVLTMTEAYHEAQQGMPTGVILTLEDGKVVYHLGDTGLHIKMTDMGDLRHRCRSIPIGDYFTMEPSRRLTHSNGSNPKHALPMHYKTFPLLAESATNFAADARETAPDVSIHEARAG